jgi:hypothetical protein
MESVTNRIITGSEIAQTITRKQSINHGDRTRSAVDTADIISRIPSIQQRYRHSFWLDTDGTVYRGSHPQSVVNLEIENVLKKLRIGTAGNRYQRSSSSVEQVTTEKEDDDDDDDDEDENGADAEEKVAEEAEEQYLRVPSVCSLSNSNSNSNSESSAPPAKRRAKKVVFFEIKVKRISAIDTTLEQFRCRFHYYLTWLSSKREVMHYYKNAKESRKEKEKESDLGLEWMPKIQWTNAAEVHEHFRDGDVHIKNSKMRGFCNEWQIECSILGFDPKKAYWNRVRYEADITFAEEFELESFPFDSQDFSLHMKVEKDCSDYCDIVPFPRKGDFCLIDPQFSVLSEWQLENLVTEFAYTDPLKSKSLRMYSLVSVHIKASRRWQAHVGVLLVTYCLFSLGLGTFSQSVDPNQLGERLGFCVTFLLADVATLQLMCQNLPNIPYWTILDFYIYTCFVFLFLITIWSCIAGAVEYLEPMDGTAYWLFLSIYVLVHAMYVGVSVVFRKRERRKLAMNSFQLERYFDGRRSTQDRRAISNTWDPSVLRSCGASMSAPDCDDYRSQIMASAIVFDGTILSAM